MSFFSTFGTRRGDELVISLPKLLVATFGGDDDVTTKSGVLSVNLGWGDDTVLAEGFVGSVRAGRGDDNVRLEDGGSIVDLGRGNDRLELTELIDFANGGRGNDTVAFDFTSGAVDIAVEGRTVILVDRFTGDEMRLRNFETVEFANTSFSRAEILENFGPDAETPFIQVGRGTQTLTVNDADPSVSVLWDRTVQASVIEENVGPTVASRAYAMMHTAMFDAWSAFNATAATVSFDQEGDNLKPGFGTDAQKIKAMSYAAITVLRDLFPDQEERYQDIMERLNLPTEDDGSMEAQIGIDAAEDLLALRGDDGANQAGGYTDTTDYANTVLVNKGPLEVVDIERWTPESIPVDPEGPAGQSFLTPHWLEVESFALEEDATGETVFDNVRPVAPEVFFRDAYASSTLNIADKTITLGADATIDGTLYTSGTTILIEDFDRQDLFDTVINPGFIEQAEVVIDYSANLSDRDKIIAEFWEDGGGTSFPPGAWMSFAQFVSARDGNSVDQDAKLFFTMGNAVMDAGIATWEAKVFYDYTRPVRAIRELGELGLIGVDGVDELTGEEGFVIEAWGGNTLGTRTILAENFVTFQDLTANVSPPFAEYTSGHSAFSAAGAEVLKQFTGSDDFGGSVTFAPGTILFEDGVPADETTLAWETFTDAAAEAGLSRLYGGIHFEDGDFNGRDLGREVGMSAYETAQAFVDGTATDADRPFADAMDFI
ncbi:MAG: DUF6851 domain-containing protein [Pseudomonadota bacterium]